MRSDVERALERWELFERLGGESFKSVELAGDLLRALVDLSLIHI